MAGAGRCVEEQIFFFQAEDGIRDYKVTGVQTCALPIFHNSFAMEPQQRSRRGSGHTVMQRSLKPAVLNKHIYSGDRMSFRSEERRVGKEGRSRWSPDH